MSRSEGSRFGFRLRWSANNLRARLGRTVLTVSGVALAVALLVSVSAFHAGYQRSLEESVDKLGFEVLVTAKGCPYEAATLFLRGGEIPMYLDSDTRTAIVADPAVGSSTEILMQATSADSGGHQVWVGVDEDYRAMKPWLSLQMGDWFAADATNVAVLGYNTATELGKAPGDTLEVPGTGASVRVVGILDRSGSQDDGSVLLPLASAQKIFDRKDSLTGVGVRLQDFAEMPDFLTRMYSLPGVQAIPMSQAQETVLSFVGSARRLLTAVGFLTALVAALALANSVLMSLLERQRELAVLRSLGATTFFIFSSVLIEASLICALGAITGIGLAVGGGALIESSLKSVVPFAPPGDLLEIDPAIVAVAFVLTLAIGIACCAYPAWRAATARPLAALRRGE